MRALLLAAIAGSVITLSAAAQNPAPPVTSQQHSTIARHERLHAARREARMEAQRLKAERLKAARLRARRNHERVVARRRAERRTAERTRRRRP